MINLSIDSEWWMTADKTPVSIESFKKLADCDSVIGDYPMMGEKRFQSIILRAVIFTDKKIHRQFHLLLKMSIPF